MNPMHVTDKASAHTIVKALQESFLEQKLCDLTVKCEGGSIKCHRAVVSNYSPLLKSMLEETSGSPQIIGIVNVKFAHLQALIKFMYTGKIRLFGKDHAELLQSATDFGMEDLVKFASDYPKEEYDEISATSETATKDTSAVNGGEVYNSSRKRANDCPSRSSDAPSHTSSLCYKKMRADTDTSVNDHHLTLEEFSRRRKIGEECRKKSVVNRCDSHHDIEKEDHLVVEKDRRGLNSSPKASVIIKRNDSERDEHPDEDKRSKNMGREKELRDREHEREKEKERRKENAISIAKPSHSTPKIQDKDEAIYFLSEEKRRPRADEDNRKESSNVSMVVCNVCNRQHRSNLDHKKVDMSSMENDKRCNYNGCSKSVKLRRSFIDHLLREHKIDVCDDEKMRK